MEKYAQLGPGGGGPCVAFLGDDKGNNADHEYTTWRSKDLDETGNRKRKWKRAFSQEFRMYRILESCHFILLKFKRPEKS